MAVMKKRFFETILGEICKEEGYKLKFFSDGWLAKISKNHKTTYTVGYNFDYNSAKTNMICNDKVLTAEVLQQEKVNTIKYFLIHNEGKKNYLGIKTSLEEDINKILEKINFPIVVKPCGGTMGRDVYLCKNKNELLKKSKKLYKKFDICLSEYIPSEFEFRFYILQNEILLAYKKIKEKNNWKHNLSTGALSELLNTEEIIKYQDLVFKTAKSLDLKVGAVDILFDRKKPIIIEVNVGIVMDTFASTSLQNRKIAKEMHRKMLKGFF